MNRGRKLLLSIGFLFLAAIAFSFILSCKSEKLKPIWPKGQELGRNGAFTEARNGVPTGWKTHLHFPVKTVPPVWGHYGMNGGKGLLMAPGKGAWCDLVQSVRYFAKGVPVTVTAWIRLDHFQGKCFVWARCAGRDDKTVSSSAAFQNSNMVGYVLKGSSAWMPVVVTVTPNESTDAVRFGLRVHGSGSVRVSEFRAKAKFGTGGPGLF